MKPYVYTLAYPDEKVFYVGKGKGRRIGTHEIEARTGKTHNPYKVHVIRKIWADGEQVIKKIQSYFETDAEATEYEIALIFFLPDLTNMTYGGEGLIGLTFTEEHRRKLSASSRGRKASKKTRLLQSQQRKGRSLTEVHRHNIGKAHKGKVYSAETRRRIGDVHKGLHHSEEARRKIGNAHKGMTHSAESRQRISDAQKGRVFTEEHRNKLAVAQMGKVASPEKRRKIGEASKGRVASEGTKQRMSDAHLIRKNYIEGECTYEEASKMLAVTIWTVKRYVVKGMLTPIKHKGDGYKYLFKEQVASLAQSRLDVQVIHL